MQNPARQVYPVLTVLLAISIVVGLTVWLAGRNRSAELVLASGQPGGSYLPLARGMAEQLEASVPNLRVRVIETDGSVENLKLLAEGQADLAFVQNDQPHDGGIRTLAQLHRGVLHFLVRADDDLQSIADLPGKRIATGPIDSGSPRIVTALLKHFGLDPEALDLRMMSLDEACSGLADETVDVILMTLGLKSPAIAELVANGKFSLRFVPIGRTIDEGSEVAGFLLDYPRAEPALIPRYAYAAPLPAGPDGERVVGLPRQSVPAVGIRSLLVARSDLPRRQARAVTEALFQQQSGLVEVHPAAAQFSEKFDSSALQFPLHPGAEAYYRRHEPGFVVRYAEVIGLSLSLLIAVAGLFATSNKWLQQRKKDRIDGFYLDLDQQLELLQNPSLEEGQLVEIEARLEAMRHQAIRLLAQERLLPNESFRIFQGLLADCQDEVRQRKAGLG